MKHSPVGGSAASRFIRCPGSVSLANVRQEDGTVIPMQGFDDNFFAAPGVAAHEVAEICLNENKEAWQLLGSTLTNGIIADREITDSAQAYVSILETHIWSCQECHVELNFHCPDIHELFYGTSDFVAAEGNVLHVYDFKHGAGVVVEVEHNEQLMYYACGALETLDAWMDFEYVRLHIVQPRAWHADGVHRSWTISTDDLCDWLYDTLIPAMDKALVSEEVNAGSHCRFCPVRFHKCPALDEVVKQVEEIMNSDKSVDAYTSEELCNVLDLFEQFKIIRAAALKSATARAQQGHSIEADGSDGWKLVKARSNRIFRDGVEKAAKEEFGDSAYNKPSLLSVTGIEKLPGGKAFAKTWAYKPDKGLTLVRGKDAREPVTKDKIASAFKQAQER